jgi:methylated-DNA-protein-cysteine methyltransferase-like protein
MGLFNGKRYGSPLLLRRIFAREEGSQSDSDTVLRMQRPVAPQNLKRRILKDALRENETRDAAFRRIIRSVPKGKVSTYGKVAAAAGYPLYHRAVARLLRKAPLQGLPWQRIVGAGGEIKLRGEAAAEQRLRLSIEGVKFRGKRVNMEICEHTLHSWETLD